MYVVTSPKASAFHAQAAVVSLCSRNCQWRWTERREAKSLRENGHAEVCQCLILKEDECIERVEGLDSFGVSETVVSSVNLMFCSLKLTTYIKRQDCNKAKTFILLGSGGSKMYLGHRDIEPCEVIPDCSHLNRNISLRHIRVFLIE